MSKHYKESGLSGVPVPEREIVIFLAQHEGKANGAILNRYAKVRWKISSTTLYKYLELLEAGSTIRKLSPSLDDVPGGNNYELNGRDLHELSRLYLHLWELSQGHEELFVGRLRNTSWYEARLDSALLRESYLFLEIQKLVEGINTDGSPDYFDSHIASDVEALIGHKPFSDPAARDELKLAGLEDRFFKTNNGNPTAIIKMFLDTSSFSGYLFFNVVRLLHEGPTNDADRLFFNEFLFNIRRALNMDGLDRTTFSDWDIGFCMCIVLSRKAKEKMGWGTITKKKIRELGLNLSILMDSGIGDE